MKTIEESLDIILKELVKNWNKPNNDRDYLKAKDLLPQLGIPQIMQKDEFFKRLIDRLVKDGYAELIETGKARFELSHYQDDTLITIEGYYFINSGGYCKQKFNQGLKELPQF